MVDMAKMICRLLSIFERQHNMQRVFLIHVLYLFLAASMPIYAQKAQIDKQRSEVCSLLEQASADPGKILDEVKELITLLKSAESKDSWLTKARTDAEKFATCVSGPFKTLHQTVLTLDQKADVCQKNVETQMPKILQEIAVLQAKIEKNPLAIEDCEGDLKEVLQKMEKLGNEAKTALQERKKDLETFVRERNSALAYTSQFVHIDTVKTLEKSLKSGISSREKLLRDRLTLFETGVSEAAKGKNHKDFAVKYNACVASLQDAKECAADLKALQQSLQACRKNIDSDLGQLAQQIAKGEFDEALQKLGQASASFLAAFEKMTKDQKIYKMVNPEWPDVYKQELGKLKPQLIAGRQMQKLLAGIREMLDKMSDEAPKDIQEKYEKKQIWKFDDLDQIAQELQTKYQNLNKQVRDKLSQAQKLSVTGSNSSKETAFVAIAQAINGRCGTEINSINGRGKEVYAQEAVRICLAGSKSKFCETLKARILQRFGEAEKEWNAQVVANDFTKQREAGKTVFKDIIAIYQRLVYEKVAHDFPDHFTNKAIDYSNWLKKQNERRELVVKAMEKWQTKADELILNEYKKLADMAPDFPSEQRVLTRYQLFQSESSQFKKWREEFFTEIWSEGNTLKTLDSEQGWAKELKNKINTLDSLVVLICTTITEYKSIEERCEEKTKALTQGFLAKTADKATELVEMAANMASDVKIMRQTFNLGMAIKYKNLVQSQGREKYNINWTSAPKILAAVTGIAETIPFLSAKIKAIGTVLRIIVEHRSIFDKRFWIRDVSGVNGPNDSFDRATQGIFDELDAQVNPKTPEELRDQVTWQHFANIAKKHLQNSQNLLELELNKAEMPEKLRQKIKEVIAAANEAIDEDCKELDAAMDKTINEVIREKK
jgi:hypothetical protein